MSAQGSSADACHAALARLAPGANLELDLDHVQAATSYLCRKYPDVAFEVAVVDQDSEYEHAWARDSSGGRPKLVAFFVCAGRI